MLQLRRRRSCLVRLVTRDCLRLCAVGLKLSILGGGSSERSSPGRTRYLVGTPLGGSIGSPIARVPGMSPVIQERAREELLHVAEDVGSKRSANDRGKPGSLQVKERD